MTITEPGLNTHIFPERIKNTDTLKTSQPDILTIHTYPTLLFVCVIVGKSVHVIAALASGADSGFFQGGGGAMDPLCSSGGGAKGVPLLICIIAKIA